MAINHQEIKVLGTELSAAGSGFGKSKILYQKGEQTAAASNGNRRTSLHR
jgi:hypothetical protein